MFVVVVVLLVRLLGNGSVLIWSVYSLVHNGQRGSAHCICDNTTTFDSILFVHNSTLHQIHIVGYTN